MSQQPQLRLTKETEPPPSEEPDQLIWKWLRNAGIQAREDEEVAASPQGSYEDFPLETAGFDAIEFQLANGNNVKVVFAKFWERLRLQDLREGARPAKYYAIKIYCTEGTLPRCMAVHWEFRAGHEFELPAVPRIWEWLANFLDERQHIQYDWLDEFIEDFAETIAEFSETRADAVQHFEHLPELTDPQAFDRVDDSVFNDQNDSEGGRA